MQAAGVMHAQRPGYAEEYEMSLVEVQAEKVQWRGQYEQREESAAPDQPLSLYAVHCRKGLPIKG